MRPPRTRRVRLRAILLWLAASGVAGAGPQPETVGNVVALPARPGPHWFWLSDILLHRTALFDADAGELLATLSSGTGGVGFVIAPLFAPDHREVYLAETYYSRGVRGERTGGCWGPSRASGTRWTWAAICRASGRPGRSSTTRTAAPRGASAGASTSPCTPPPEDSTRSCTRAVPTPTKRRAPRYGST